MLRTPFHLNRQLSFRFFSSLRVKASEDFTAASGLLCSALLHLRCLFLACLMFLKIVCCNIIKKICCFLIRSLYLKLPGYLLFFLPGFQEQRRRHCRCKSKKRARGWHSRNAFLAYCSCSCWVFLFNFPLLFSDTLLYVTFIVFADSMFVQLCGLQLTQRTVHQPYMGSCYSHAGRMKNFLSSLFFMFIKKIPMLFHHKSCLKELTMFNTLYHILFPL